jgi:hypothetical protein
VILTRRCASDGVNSRTKNTSECRAIAHLPGDSLQLHKILINPSELG